MKPLSLGNTEQSDDCPSPNIHPWLKRILPKVLQPWKPTKQRISIEKQLESRSGFPFYDWVHCGMNVNFVVPILKLVAQEMEWPNYFFLPNDPLSLVCVEGCNELGFSFVLAALKGEWHIHHTEKDIKCLLEINNPTMLDFVKWVDNLSKSKRNI